MPIVVAGRPAAAAAASRATEARRHLGRTLLAFVAVVAVAVACGVGGSALVRSRIETGTAAANAGSPSHDGETPALVLPTTPPTSTAPQGAVDLGHGIEYRLPVGVLANTHTDGTVFASDTTELFVRVGVRPPGEDPAVMLQEYTNELDLGSESVSYSPAFPLLLATTRNGYWAVYASVHEDGSLHRGYIEVTRRSDGLTLLTDQHATLAAEFDAVFTDAYAELDSALASAEAVATGVALDQPAVRALTSIHSTMSFAGLVSLSSPTGWTTSEQGPARVAATGPGGGAVVVAHVAPGTGAPADAIRALLGSLVDNVSLTEATPSSINEHKLEAEFDATDATGAPVHGVAWVWTTADGTPTDTLVIWQPTGTVGDERLATLLFVLDTSLGPLS